MDPTSSITSMSAAERVNFEEVGKQCQGDVDQICDGRFYPGFFSFPPPPPIMLMDDIGSIVENAMRSIMVPDLIENQPQDVPADEHNNERGLDMIDQQPQKSIDQEPQDEVQGPLVVIHSAFPLSPCEEMFVRHMLSQFVPLIAADETETLAQKLVDHGNTMMESEPEEGSHEFRVARRLSEVTPEEVMQHRRDYFLPFGSEKNECLVQAYNDRRVSFPCGSALRSLDQVRTVQFQIRNQQRMAEVNAYANLTTMYFLIFATAVVLFCFRKKMISKGNCNPGNVQKMRQMRLLTVIFFSGMTTLCLTGILSISILLVACVWFSAYVFVRALFVATCDNEAECACCCCAATPEDAHAGNLTELQACCDCCQGTGLCSDQCASCCGDNGCCGADCCAEGCCGGEGGCCCGGESSPSDYKLLTDETNCCKSDKKMVKDGCCCCDAPCCANGCCGGEGGCCCCDGDISPDKKKILKSRHEIYEGVPIQIV